MQSSFPQHSAESIKNSITLPVIIRRNLYVVRIWLEDHLDDGLFAQLSFARLRLFQPRSSFFMRF